MLLTNIPGANLFHMDLFLENQINIQQIVTEGGMLDFLYLGVKLGIYPPLIFLGVGAMTDFSPLIANPKTLFLGAAAQFGVFVAFIGALLLGFTVPEAASIGIIGGADGPTAILVTKTLAPALLGAIAIAAYSYMALVPFIQPPIMKLCTTKKERAVKMEQLRPVSKTEQILFPVVVTVVVCLILPEATSLIGMLMLGNLFRVCGVVDRLSKTAQNEHYKHHCYFPRCVRRCDSQCRELPAVADDLYHPSWTLRFCICYIWRRHIRQADVRHYKG